MIWIILGIVGLVAVGVIVWAIARSRSSSMIQSDIAMAQAVALKVAEDVYDQELEKRADERAANADENTIKDLIEEFNTSYDEGWEASQALLRIGKPAVPHLIQALKEREGYKCAWAMETLEKMGSLATDAVPVLEEIANDPSQKEDRRREATEAISKIS